MVDYTVDRLKGLGAFRDIDRHIADYLCSAGGEGSPLFFLVVMLLSRSVGQGHVCLSLDSVAGRSLSWLSADDPDNAETYENIILPGVPEIKQCVMRSKAAGADGSFLPLILDGTLLYFHRQYSYEKKIAMMIRSMCVAAGDFVPGDSITRLFRRLFPDAENDTDMQSSATLVSLSSRFSVLSGGPGTGKTSTVVKILLLVTEARRMNGLGTAIALAAPTGKAAARLAGAVSVLRQNMQVQGEDADFSAIPAEAFTLHRLLGYRGEGGGFRYGSGNNLDYDVVVVDECSMADMPLMYRLLSALKPGSRLILSGDKDQLASVEGGAVFGDICGRGTGEYPAVSPGNDGPENILGLLRNVSAESGSVAGRLTFLSKSWRFGKESGIGALASAVRRGNDEAVIKLLGAGSFKDITWIQDVNRQAINGIIFTAAGDYIPGGATGAGAVEGFISSFCILSAVRRGPYGMEGMNIAVEKVLESMGIINASARFYEGRPVMVTGNDYSLSLFNGDIGIVREGDSGMSAVFRLPDGTGRFVHTNRLPEHETAYAMTVHKSQGSELDEVLIVLPPVWNPVMTRELLYTALTRGRKKVTIAADEAVIRKMVSTGLERMSGLAGRLHG